MKIVIRKNDSELFNDICFLPLITEISITYLSFDEISYEHINMYNSYTHDVKKFISLNEIKT